MRSVRPGDRAEWARLRQLLWPGLPEEHERETARFLDERRAGLEVLVLDTGGGRLAGFVELSERTCAEGCEASPVAYIEGWFVEPSLRGHGWGRALVAAGEAWARARGHREIASDTEIHNVESQAAHRALGYEETDRIVCFRKSLT